MSAVSDFINSIPQDAVNVGNTLVDAGSHALLPLTTTNPVRAVTQGVDNATNLIAKLRGAPLYGSQINTGPTPTAENGALSSFTPSAQAQLRKIPIVRQNPTIPLPQTDLTGDTQPSTKPYGAVTINANLIKPYQRQIIFPPNQTDIPSQTLSYEYNHALLPPAGYTPMTMIRDFESMKDTHPEMYKTIKQSLAAFDAPTTPATRESYAAELMSSAAQKYGTKILDTPLGIYYNNILKPNEGQQVQGSLPTLLRGAIQGVTGPITDAMQQTNEENSRLPSAYHNPSQAFQNASMATGNLARNTVLNPRVLADVASVAIPSGMGATAPIVSGALSGGLNAAAQPNPSIQGVLRNAALGGVTGGIVQGVGDLAGQAFSNAPQATQTIGDIQEANQRANGLGLLADYDNAARTGDDKLMGNIVQQILSSNSPAYAPYKQVFAKLSGL